MQIPINCGTLIAHAKHVSLVPLSGNRQISLFHFSNFKFQTRSFFTMADIRLQRMARLLVQYSLGIKKGDRLAIVTGPQAAPLVREVVREAVRAGAYPETFVSLPGVQEVILKEGSDKQLSYISAAQRMIFE